MAAIGVPAGIGAGIAIGVFAVLTGEISESTLGPVIGKTVNDWYNAARVWFPKKDPLTLDLDGDGLETVGIDPNNPILFDHDGDGLKNATGWIKPDDGFLAYDRNGNGLIDDGTELFGDSTSLYAGGQAADGFAALAQEDTTNDGLVDANDAHFADLRIWRDLNSNGTTEAGELQTLTEAGIAGLHVAKRENTTRLANGNELADLGSYIKTDGTEAALGNVTGGMGDIDLAANPFYRQYTDHLDTSNVADLPDMQGSGTLRDLKEAASTSAALAAAVTAYAAADTKAGQLALADSVIAAWAATSGFQTSIEQARDHGYNLTYLVPGLTAADMDTTIFGVGSAGNGQFTAPDPAEQARLDARKAEQARITQQLALLEKFNGLTFVNLEDDGVRTGANRFLTAASSATGGYASFGGASKQVYLTLSTTQINFLDQAYAAIKQSVYDGLLTQTRLKPYLDAVQLNITDTGIGMDFSQVDAAFQTRYGQAPKEAAIDLLDLQRMSGANLNGLGWDGYGQLRGWLDSALHTADTAQRATLLSALTSALGEFGYPGLVADGNGSDGNEAVLNVDSGVDSGASLAGNGGNDLLLGGAGDDTLDGGSGNDILYGSAGNDTYIYTGGQDTIVETDGANGTDTLQFGAGIHAGELSIARDGGNLVFTHINGRDSLTIANWFDGLTDSAHRLDAVRFADGSTLDLAALQLGGSGADTIIGTSNSDILMGGAGNDTLISDGNDWLDGGTGADTMTGSIGDDMYVVDNAGDVVIELAGEGNDTVYARAGATLADHVENLRLVGTAAIGGIGNELANTMTGNESANALYGMAGDDTLVGNGGNDRLDGGVGADLMAGGTGNDTYVVETLADTVTELAGQGKDTVLTGLDYILGANLENLTLTGADAVDGTGNELANELTGNDAVNTLTGLAGDDTLDGGLGADTLLGGTGDDTYVVDNVGDLVVEAAGAGADTVQSSINYALTDNAENLALTGTAALEGSGNALNNSIAGNQGANVLRGLDGDDILDGGAGADTLIGGTGDDTYVVDNAGDAVVENTGEGVDTVASTMTYTLGDDVENLTLLGAVAIDATGNDVDNVLKGNHGANVLDGGLGADTMAGGGGNDTYLIDNAGDTIIERYNEGVDTVIAPFDTALTDNVENLVLAGAAVTGTGNNLGNTITGTAADNTLTGLGGNDTLNGGAGADTLVGGTGDDTYVVDSLLDSIVEVAGEGDDTVRSSLTWTLADHLENLTLTGTDAIDGTGNEAGNVITGNSAANMLTALGGNDTLDGGAGADTMLGGSGNDTYVVDDAGDAVTEYADEGTDTVLSGITYALGDHLENLTLTGGANIDGAGNGADNVITGNTGNNTLIGLDGNDLLDGGKGVDTLIGGADDDVYVVDSSNDVVVEAFGEGVDVVQAAASYVLSDNVEQLILTGTASINATGNALDNTLTGNGASNVLDGGVGADTMSGGAGNDTYVVDDIGDAAIEGAGAGIDTVRATIDYTLAANTEILELIGSANLDGMGNDAANMVTGNAGDNVLSGMAGNDMLIGNAGNDLLDGGTGADLMSGGAGDDVYIVDNAGDVVSETAGEGIDTVRSGIGYTLTDNVESLVLTGTGNINAKGNALDNVLTGNGGNNMLDGGAGADTMSGGAGNDTYIVDNVGDTVSETSGEGTDTVVASVDYALGENVESLVLTGTGGLSGVGNALNNSLTGNGGNNVLDGGVGADTLTGGAGDDVYVLDDSADIVTELAAGGADTVLASASYVLSENIENLTLAGSGDIAGTGNALDNVITANSGLNVLAGGAGNDTYIVDNTADAVVENVGEGVDTIQSSATYTLSDNVENLELIGAANIDGTGNALDNVLTGNSGDNALEGGVGADAMSGGAGNDTYLIDNAGDSVAENAGEGADTVIASVSYTLAGNVENMVLTGTADIDATGNGLDNSLVGNSGNNKLYGLAGDDMLTGNQGNDLLDGGSGADAMAGNAGDDIYVVDNAGDTVTENAGEGTDTVQSSVTHALSDNVENLVLTGTAAINGTGNALNNAVTGNSANNVLDGGAGVDALSGGAGNDTYVVDDTADAVIEGANAGTDTVLAGATYTLSANVENLTLTGSGDIDGTGNALANVITANSGINVLAGGAGNDTYIVDNTADAVVENAGEGTDLVQSSATYSLSANVENLTLTGAANIDGTGNTLANTMVGNSGNNVIDGGVGADSMSGSAGNDTYIVDNAGDVVTEAASAGTDLVNSSVAYTLTANVENLTLTGVANINGTGNTLNNVILGNSGNNVLDGSTGADSMAGGLGNDTYVVDNTGDVVTENVEEGTDTVQSSVTYTLSANVENLTLTGTAAVNGTGNALDNVIIGNTGNNVLSGLAGNDSMTGNAGNDTLDGGTGTDVMAAGAGNDTYVVDDAGDVVTENLNEGTDLVQSSITYTLTANVENLTLTGTANIDGTGNTLANTITGNAAANVLDGGAGNDTITAGGGNDTVTGGDGDDSLAGDAGSDVLAGNAGNDTLNGGLDADSMTGGIGNDTYVVDNVGDLVVESAAEGTDLVQSSIAYTLTDNVENLTLTGTAAISGTGNVLNNVLTGNTAANTLYGLDGNDTLNGGTGADTLVGGTGNDTYVVDNTGDVVVEAASEGADTVQSSVTYTLSANVENLTLTGTAAINGTGNALDNVIVGNTGNNVLSGLAGNDTLTGNAGNDTLDGGTGTDVMAAGAGNDSYVVDDAGDVVTENLNEGTDLVQSSINYTLTANVENLSLTGTTDLTGTGNTLANVITGNAGANVLDGGAGDDTLNGGLNADSMTGGIGNDTYVVDNIGDLVAENAAEGTDLVQSSIAYTLTDNVENLTLTGIALINGTGNVLNNVLTGNTAANTLYGLDGNDTLNGGTGADTLVGGTGNDTYVVDNTGDVVTEAAGEGTDLVQSSVTYTLSANVENLTLTGTAAINGTGNELDNVIVGNSGNNLLSGMAGNDTLTGNAGNDTLDGGLDVDAMAGNAGNDTYVVDNASDVVTENVSEGTDLVQASISYTLGANVENLTLTGTVDLNGTGNTLANVITGNAGANVLDGGSGADTLVGGAGNDTYVIDNTGDVITEAAGGGTDIARASVTYSLAANVENLTLTGTAAVNGTGNVLDNILVGNTAANTLSGDLGNDTLDGGAGADTMQGGGGDDTYLVDNSGDIVTEALSSGNDAVLSGINYTLTANVENLTLTGTADLSGTGNALDNVMIGNAGNNVLDGSAGNDSYFFGIGSGEDRIVDIQGDDTLRIGSGLNELDLKVERAGDSLLIRIDGTADSVTLNNWYGYSQGVNRFVFDNGAILDRAGIDALVNRPPVANADAVSVSEDGGSYTFTVSSLLANDTDQNAADTLSLTSVGSSQAGASVTLVDGQVIYDLGNSFQQLAEGEVIHDSFSYTITDNKGGVSSSQVNVDIVGANDAPTLMSQPADQMATEDALYSFVLPTDTFGDIDAGDVLVYAATMANGDALPEWLGFDAATATFSGTPGNGDVGRLQLQVTATDTAGARVSAMFSLAVENVNDAPVAQEDAVVVDEDTAVIITQSTLTGNDSDIDPTADALVVVSVGNGMHGSVGLGEDGTIHFTPDADFNGAASFDYTIADGNGGYASSSVSVQVNPVNDTPMVTGALADLLAVEDQTFSVTLPMDAFSDIDAGDQLAYTAALVDGSALPSWLTFDATTRTFVGTPRNGDVGALSIAVTASDLSGAQASQTFALQVANTNDAPVVNAVFADQVAIEDAPFSLALPTDLFADVDVGDSLTYTAMLADGTALPSWLAFDPVAGTFSGMPGNGDVGDLNVSLIATDRAGATATQSFAITVLNVNDVPVAAADTVEVTEDGTLEAIGNVLANDTDIDVGDILSVAGAGTYQGSYGQLTLAADGNYRYLLDNAAAQALGDGERVVEHFAYGVTDGAVDVSGTLEIAVTGQNDAPVVVAPLDPVAITVGSALSWTLPAGTFVDADTGDTLMYGLVQEDGTDLPSWLTFDAATRTLTGTPATTDTGALHLALVAMDGAGAWAGGLLEIDIAAPQGHGEVVVGTADSDLLSGTDYDDVLDGRGGVDTLAGGNGNDLYLIDANHDDLYSGDEVDCDGVAVDAQEQEAIADIVVEDAGAGYDTVWSSIDYTLTANVESLMLLGGKNLEGAGNASDNLLIGNRGNNGLYGLSGNDLLLGGLGNDQLFGGDGLDALDGGYGNDTLEDGAGNGFVAGGRGNDRILLQGGTDIIAFNRGDGRDTVQGGDGRNDTLSLGGGIRLADLKLGKEGKDLLLDTGNGDAVRMVDWYASGNYKTVSTLQIAHTDDATQFDRYDFSALIASFDSHRTSSNSAKSWTVSGAASAYKLAGTQPAGGVVAVAYAENGDLEHLHPDTVSAALSSTPAPAAETGSVDGSGASDSGSGTGSPSTGDGSSGSDGLDNALPDDSPDYWSQLDAPVAEDTWDTAPVMADVAADWLHYAEQNGYDTVSSGDSRIDYAVTWARLRDELAGLLDDDQGSGHGHWMFSHDGRGVWLGNSGSYGSNGMQVNLPGNLLKQFEGLKEGVDRLHV